MSSDAERDFLSYLTPDEIRAMETGEMPKLYEQPIDPNPNGPEGPNAAYLKNPRSRYIHYPDVKPIDVNFTTDHVKPNTIKYGVDITAAARDFLASGRVTQENINEYLKNQKKEFEDALGKYREMKAKADQEVENNLKRAESISRKLSNVSSKDIDSMRSSLLSTLKYNFQDTQTPQRSASESKNVVRVFLQKPTLVFGTPHPFDTINKYLSKSYPFGPSPPMAIFKAVASILAVTAAGFYCYIRSIPFPRTLNAEWKSAIAERRRRIGPDDYIFSKWKPGMTFEKPEPEALRDITTIDDVLADIDEQYILGKLKESYSEFEDCNTIVEAAKLSAKNPDILREYSSEMPRSEDYLYTANISLEDGE